MVPRSYTSPFRRKYSFIFFLRRESNERRFLKKGQDIVDINNKSITLDSGYNEFYICHNFMSKESLERYEYKVNFSYIDLVFDGEVYEESIPKYINVEAFEKVYYYSQLEPGLYSILEINGVSYHHSVTIYDKDGNVVDKTLNTFEDSREAAMKNGYDHFMLKEIYEQPKVIMDTIGEYIYDIDHLNERMSGLEKYDAVDIIGCGSAYHVGLIGKSLITKYANIPVNVDIASEYRYTNHVYSKKHLIVLISQSGETADTLAVLRNAKENGIDTLAIVNVVGSSIAREANKVLYIKAGPEIAVATTKAYSCQLMMLSLIAMYLGIKKGNLKDSIFFHFFPLKNLRYWDMNDN